MRCLAGIVGFVATVAVTLALVAWQTTPPPLDVAAPGEPAPELVAVELSPDVELAPVSGEARPVTKRAGSPSSGE